MKRALLFVAIAFHITAIAQVRAFSVATHFSVLRNLTQGEQFTVVGQQVQVNLHFSAKESAYASVEYYTDGKFENNFTAAAKQATTSPQTIPFRAKGSVHFRELSLGLKHYFAGNYFALDRANFYGIAGVGVSFFRVQNSFFPSFDPAVYNSPVTGGQKTITKFTFDAGIGGEKHLRGPLFGFATLRTWVPLSNQTSTYLHSNERFPRAIMGGIGVRVLFSAVY